MADKKSLIIELTEHEASNDELFIRKGVSSIPEDTKVIVDETHVAILLQNGVALETLKPGSYVVRDKKSLFSKPDKLGTFRLELFYISKTAKVRMLWGTPVLFDIQDPINQVPAKMGANGEIEIRIRNPRQFYIELVGSNKKFTIDDLKERLKDVILSRIEPTIINYVEFESVELTKVNEERLAIARFIQKDLDKELSLNYGLEVSNVVVNSIKVDIKEEKLSDKITKKNVCPRCGFILSTGSKFCNNCGARLDGNI